MLAIFNVWLLDFFVGGADFGDHHSGFAWRVLSSSFGLCSCSPLLISIMHNMSSRRRQTDRGSNAVISRANFQRLFELGWPPEATQPYQRGKIVLAPKQLHNLDSSSLSEYAAEKEEPPFCNCATVSTRVSERLGPLRNIYQTVTRGQSNASAYSCWDWSK